MSAFNRAALARTSGWQLCHSLNPLLTGARVCSRAVAVLDAGC
jgi:hypothetical protein